MKPVLILSAAAVTLIFTAPVYAGGANGCNYSQKMKQAFADDQQQGMASALTEEQSEALRKIHLQLTGEDSTYSPVLVTEQLPSNTE